MTRGPVSCSLQVLQIYQKIKIYSQGHAKVMLLLSRCSEMLSRHNSKQRQTTVLTTNCHHTSARSSKFMPDLHPDLHLTSSLVDPLTLSLTTTSRVPDSLWLKVVLLKNGSASRHSHLPGSFSGVPQTCSQINLRYLHNTLSTRHSSEVLW